MSMNLGDLRAATMTGIISEDEAKAFALESLGVGADPYWVIRAVDFKWITTEEARTFLGLDAANK